jgi:glyoxylase-like metal-dependent hydrolase (beta-lactamase superfamily II)
MKVIQVGGAEIRRVEEMTISSPISTLTEDRALLDANRHWLEPRFLKPDDHWNFVFQSWIMIVDDRVFVIDPCNGNGRPHVVPVLDMLDTPYLERFVATGIRPGDVDHVFCTHLHHDHCGWSTQLRDGRFVPTFPNARYIYVRREYERWDPGRPDHKPVDYNVGVFEQSVRPILEAGLANLVSDRHRVSPSVETGQGHGHTLGHSIVHLRSRAEEAYFTGDVFHHPLQIVHPELHMPGDDDLQQGIETRRRLVTQCAERGALVLPAHFPEPHAGYVRRTDGAASFEPLSR